MTRPSAALVRVVRRCIQPRYPLAKKQVVEVRCERCPRVEYVDASAPAKPAITIIVGDAKQTFEDLCGSCRTAVESHLAEITKKLGGRSPKRGAKKEQTASQPPAPSPNGSAGPPRVSSQQPQHAKAGSSGSQRA